MMLAFDRQAAFEAWLQQCPLDERSLRYGVERRFEGLTVTCSWTLPAAPVKTKAIPTSGSKMPLALDPAQLAGGRKDESQAESQLAGGTKDEFQLDDEQIAAEIATTRSKLAELQKVIPAEVLQEMAAGASRTSPGATMAAMLMQQRGAAGADTSAEGVRAAMSAMGVSLPKPPGRAMDK